MRPLASAFRGLGNHWSRMATGASVINCGRQPCEALGDMIDQLEPCNWHFEENVEMLCKAIGGNLRPGGYYAFCGRNVNRRPERGRMRVVARTLKHFSGINRTHNSIDGSIIRVLGKKAQAKLWLAAFFAIVIRKNFAP